MLPVAKTKISDSRLGQRRRTPFQDGSRESANLIFGIWPDVLPSCVDCSPLRRKKASHG